MQIVISSFQREVEMQKLYEVKVKTFFFSLSDHTSPPNEPKIN